MGDTNSHPDTNNHTNKSVGSRRTQANAREGRIRL